MKNLILLLPMALVLAACGSGGGSAAGGGGGGNKPDATPHDYTILFAALTNTNQLHTGDLHQTCAVGYAGFRDDTASFTLQDPNLSGGIGCGSAENVIFEATNTGTLELYVSISVDGVNLPDVIVQPGDTYTFTRGY